MFKPKIPATPDTVLQVYLAGPDVFYPNCIEIGIRKKELIAQAGCLGHFPLDPVIENFLPDEDTAFRIFKGNEGLMNQCQVILANMIPWHGSPSMDVGTAFEVGYMSCKARFSPGEVLIIGYYEGDVETRFIQRVAKIHNDQLIKHEDGRITDLNGTGLENFNLSENLMIHSAITKTGGAIYTSFEEAVNNIHPLWRNRATGVRALGPVNK